MTELVSRPATGSHRAIAVLRAVAAGRVEITRSCEPDLYIDGIPFCDQATAHQLAHAQLLEADTVVRTGQRALARLTPLGRAVLAGNTLSPNKTCQSTKELCECCAAGHDAEADRPLPRLETSTPSP